MIGPCRQIVTDAGYGWVVVAVETYRPSNAIEWLVSLVLPQAHGWTPALGLPYEPANGVRMPVHSFSSDDDMRREVARLIRVIGPDLALRPESPLKEVPPCKD